MKSFIIIVCFIVPNSFCLFDSLLIISYEKLIKSLGLLKGEWDAFPKMDNKMYEWNYLCGRLDGAQIIVASDKVTDNDNDFSYGDDLSGFQEERLQIAESRIQNRHFLIGYEIKSINSLSCQFQKSVVYLAKHKSHPEKYFLFGKKIDSASRKLLAVVMLPISFTSIIYDAKKLFTNVTRNGNFQKNINNFFSQNWLEKFQFCACAFWNISTSRKWLKKKYFLISEEIHPRKSDLHNLNNQNSINLILGCNFHEIEETSPKIINEIKIIPQCTAGTRFFKFYIIPNSTNEKEYFLINPYEDVVTHVSYLRP